MNRTYHINPDWKRLAKQIVMPNQRVLVLGASDSGKSTFCRYLIDSACDASLKAALVDADVGQSQIGPPTTIGMKMFESAQVGDKHHLPFGGNEDPKTNTEQLAVGKNNIGQGLNQKADTLYFVGALSPERNLLPVLTGTRLMVDTAIDAGAEFIVIDTTGYVHDGAASMLKQQKIDLIRPNHIVCLGKSKDLDRIVGCYSNINSLTIHHLLPHKLTRTKSSVARKKNRTERFKIYFADSQLQKISFEKIRGARTSFFNGRIANQKELEILCRLTETDVTYAEWGHRSISLIARRKLTQDATKSLKNYLSLSSVSAETPAYFRQRLVGMVDSAGDTSGIGIIEVVDFQNKELHIRCNSGIASKIKVLQFGDYRYNETQ